MFLVLLCSFLGDIISFLSFGKLHETSREAVFHI